MGRYRDYDELDEMQVPQGYSKWLQNDQDGEDGEGDGASPEKSSAKKAGVPAKKTVAQKGNAKKGKGKAFAAGAAVGGVTVGAVFIAYKTLLLILAGVAAFALLVGGLVWVGMTMGDRAGIGSSGNEVIVQKADPEPGRTYFKSEIDPPLSAEGVKGRLKEVYYTKDGGLGVTLRLSNGTSSEQKLVTVGIRIFNDADETIAQQKIDSFKPVCKIPAGGYNDVYFTIDKDSVAVKDDSLKSLGTTLEIGSQPTDGNKKNESDGTGPKDIAPNRTYFENMGNIPELSAEGVKAAVVRARYTNDGSLSVTLSFSNGTETDQQVSKVDVLIQNGNGETVAKQIFDTFDPACIVKKQSYTEYELIIDAAYVSIQDDPLSTLANTVSVSAGGIG